MQAWNLALSLVTLDLKSEEETEIHLHYTLDISEERLNVFRNMGVKLIRFSFSESESGGVAEYYSQLNAAVDSDADYCVFLDLGSLMVSDVRDWCADDYFISFSQNRPDLHDDVWRNLLSLVDPQERDLEKSIDDAKSLWRLVPDTSGCGFHILSKGSIDFLVKHWIDWSEKCLILLEAYDYDNKEFSYDFGFVLSLIVSKTGFIEFDRECAGIFDYKRSMHDWAIDRLSIIQYWDNMDNTGLPEKSGSILLDSKLAGVVKKIQEVRRQYFDNQIFWDFRYFCHPAIGSGIGSRGKNVEYKRACLEPFEERYCKKKVLDVGCGDIETTRYTSFLDYTGLDTSDEALILAQKKRPDWKFVNEFVDSFNSNIFDLVICLDVLIHQETPQDYQDLVKQLIRVSKEALIVSGFDDNPGREGTIFFHERLSDSLRNHDEIVDFMKIGSYRGVSVFYAKK